MKKKIGFIFAFSLLVVLVVISTVLANMLFTTLIHDGIYTRSFLYLKPEYTIQTVDEELTEKYGESYLGYYHGNNFSIANVNGNGKKAVNVFHLSEESSIEFKNDYDTDKLFDKSDNRDLLPIIVSGMDNGYRVNQKLKLTMYSEAEGSSFDVNCIIVDKVFSLWSIVQADVGSYKQYIDTARCTFIIPDTYRDRVIAEDNKYAVSIESNETTKNAAAELKKYGVVAADTPISSGIYFEVFPSIMVGLFCIMTILLSSFLTFKCGGYNFKKKFDFWIIVHFALLSIICIGALLLFKLTPLASNFIINIIPIFIILALVLVFYSCLYFVSYKKQKKVTATDIRGEYEKI